MASSFLAVRDGRPTREDYDALISRQCYRREVIYTRLADEALPAHEATRVEVLDATVLSPSAQWTRESFPPGMASLAARLVSAHGLSAPVGAIAHRNTALGWHTDVRNPVPCLNALVVFRDRCEGGRLVLSEPRLAIDCADGWLTVFDGSRPHAVTALEPESRRSTRVSLTFYCPTGALES